MNKKINCLNLIDILEEVNNPFSREKRLAQIKADYGSGELSYYDTGNGMAIANVRHKLNQDIIATLDSEESLASLIFNLGDDIEYRFSNNKKYTFKKNTFFLGFSTNEFSVDMHFKKNILNHTFTIDIQNELFKNLTKGEQVFDEKINQAQIDTYSFFDIYEIDLEQLEFLNYFKEQSKEKDLATNLQMEGKIIDFILYTIEKIKKSHNQKNSLDKNIVKSLQKAKSIITTDYAHNLSIKEIAYRSAINECYLKKEFKSYYNMTIFEMIQKHRLEMAKVLLQENFSVKEAALQVGYKHSGNFSKLFNQSYGLSPSNYRRQFN